MNRHFLTAAAIAATATACFLPERHSDVSWDRPPLSTASAPTYHKDVESIFQRQCQNCHRPGAIAPFSMLTYDDARKHAREIRSSVADGSMPPWKLEAGCGEFRDTRGLTKEEIATVTSWVDANTPEGDVKDAPAPVKFPDGWQLGNPDQLLASSAPYTIEPSGDDDYRCFVLPYTADLDRWVTGYEIQPDKASVVHHVILYLDYLGESAKLDHQDGKPGYTCFGGPGVSRAGVLGGWAPGTVARFAPPGIGTPVPAGAKMVMQVHYHHDGKLEMDQTRVGLHFAAQKPEHNLEIWGVLNKEFKIPAGNAAYSVGAELELPFNVHVVNIFPHMHLLGKDMRVEAITPDGANRCMVHVPDWDFDWQGFYEYKDFIALPKGTKIRLTATYDNSELNPNQFNHPPKDVSYGEKTTDEMALAFFSIIRD